MLNGGKQRNEYAKGFSPKFDSLKVSRMFYNFMRKAYEAL